MLASIMLGDFINLLDEVFGNLQYLIFIIIHDQEALGKLGDLRANFQILDRLVFKLN